MQPEINSKQPTGLKLDEGKSEEGEHSFALNAVLTEDADRLLQNEPGNTNIITFQKQRVQIGAINISRTEIAIFSVIGEKSYIGLQIGDTYSDIVEAKLNFNVSNPIKGFFVLVKGCERTVYFNDDLNTDRYFNFDDINSFKTNGEWDTNKFKQKPTVNQPNISNIIVNNTGGSLKSGKYSFAVEILDKDENTLFLSQSTRGINIWFDSLGNSYQDIHGSFNLDNTSLVDGGKDLTNKSITLSLTNLDTSFYYYRIWILRNISSDNTTIEVIKKNNLQRIINSNAQVTIRSVDTQDIITTYSDYLISSSDYVTCRDSVLVTGRQVKSNLKAAFVDYSDFQKATNDITVKWISKSVTPFVQSVDGNSKNPLTPNSYMSLAGDEIYSLAIEYHFNDGRISPPFPLIGRVANDYDLEVLTYDSQNPDFKHLEIKTSYARHEVYNTAKSDGTLGYYEAEQDYPDTVDCNGERLFPEGKIRYFKMPDRRLVPISTTEGFDYIALLLIGLEFSNVVYPSTDIKSHRFLVAKRTEENKTVIDSGIIFGKVDADAEFSTYPDTVINFNDIYPDDQVVNSDICAFISPKQLVEGSIQADYFKVNKLLARSNTISGSETYKISGENTNIKIRQFIDEYINYSESPITNVNITNILDININSTVNSVLSSLPIRNYSFSNPITVFKCSSIYPQETKLSVVTLKKDIKPYSSFESLAYIPFADTNFIASSSSNIFQVFGGDVYISELEISNLWGTDYDYSFIPGLQKDEIEFFAEYANRIWVESEVNYSLLAIGTDCQTRYIQGDNFFDYMVTKIADLNPDNNQWVLKPICPEYYGYNKDFTFSFLGRESFILPSNFKYCSSCYNNNPNLIIWSEKYFSEQITDSLRVFKGENYKIVGENTGQITGLYFDLNRLLVRTEQSRYIITPNPQEIVTDSETAFLGTGDFLSIPPRELVATSYGYAGGTGYLDELSTEFGLFSVDLKANRVFLITSGQAPEDLSDIKYKCSQWLRNNLTSTDEKNAIQLGYDPYRKRIIMVHKKNNWTFSFDLRSRRWISFHSYIPRFIYNDGLTFYTFDTQYISKHLTEGSYQFYNNKKYDWIVGFQFFKFTSTTLYNLYYYCRTVDGNLDLSFPTFDRMWVFTKAQSTGLIKLLEPDPQYGTRGNWVNDEAYVTHNSKNYRISKIRNLATGSHIVDSTSYEPKPIGVDITMRQQDQIYLEDKYFNVILYSNNPNDYKMIFNLLQTIGENKEL